MIDFIARVVPNYGFLPIITRDGVEIYRGEFKRDAQAAIKQCEGMLPIILQRLVDLEGANG